MLKIISEIKDFLKENNCRTSTNAGEIKINLPSNYKSSSISSLDIYIYTDTLSIDPVPSITIPVNKCDDGEVLILTASLRVGFSSGPYETTIDVYISHNNTIIMNFVTDMFVELSEVVNDYNMSNNIYLLSVLRYFST